MGTGAKELQGHLDGMLLAIIGCGPLHGYAIVEELRRRSNGAFDLAEGTLYPALHRLEAAGLLSSHWDGSGQRRRRVYSISSSGRKAAVQRRANWHAFKLAVDSVIGTAAPEF